MQVRLSLAAITAMTVAAMASAQTVPAKPPVEAFATLPVVDGASISPDGKLLAMIQVDKGRPVATVWKLGPEIKLALVQPFDKGFITDVQWANDTRLLITINFNARALYDKVNPWFRTIAIDADGKNTVELFSNKKTTREFNYMASRISDLAPGDPDHIYMPLFVPAGNDARLKLYKVNVNDGTAEESERGGDDTIDWVMDGQGRAVVRVDRTNHPRTDHILTRGSTGEWKELASIDASDGEGASYYGLTADGQSLVLSSSGSNTDTSGLVAMSLNSGKKTDLFFDPIYDSGAVIDPWSMRVVGAAMTRHMPKHIFFESDLQRMQAILETAFPGLSSRAATWDRLRRKFIVRVQGPTTPQTYYLADLVGLRIDSLGRDYPELQPSDLGQVQVYTYKARDGLDILAYLTMPPGKAAKNLPVVVLLHGGPMSRDDMRFDWESQFLANRGYAVLRPNFRGSSGFGKTFMEAGYGQWGLKMQDDITDGVTKLIADGIADPKRICIAGGSYGGYAALAGAAFTPELYACAASWAGVSDLRHFLSTRSAEYGEDSAMIASWTRFIGDRWNDSDKLDAASPAEHADKINCPVLLMHGKDDSTVRIDQSERMDRALRRNNKKVTFITIAKETHYMQTTDTRVRWLTELEKFLKENIGN